MEDSRALSVAELTSMTERVGEGGEGVTMQAMLGASISLLGREFFVALIKKAKEGDYTFLLAPKKLETLEEVSLNQLIGDIARLFGKGEDPSAVNTSELEKILPEGSKFEDIKVCLTMAYIYYDKDTKEDGTQEIKTEYAFEITLNGLKDKLIPPELKSLATVNSVQVALWNTSNKKILEAMNIVDPNEYLNNL